MKSIELRQTVARLRYLEFDGRGPPLLMLHGLGCASSFEFPPIARSPALRDRHVLLVDLLGFGYSDRPTDFGYGVSDHASVVIELIDACGFGTVNLFGHSMGGSVAIEAADKLGVRVECLILAEANLDSGGGMISRPITAMGETTYAATGHDQIIAEALADGDDAWATTMRRADPRAVFLGARSLVEGASPSWRSRLLGHPARKTFIFGEKSLPDDDVGALPDAGIPVATVSDAGHAMGIDNPEGLARAVATALADPAVECGPTERSGII